MDIPYKKYISFSMFCNGYLVEGPDGWVAIDAPESFAEWVLQKLPAGAKLTDLLITHQHFDHVDDVAELQEKTGCKVHAAFPYSQENTLELLDGMGCPAVRPFHVDDVFGMASVRTEHWGGLEWTVYPIPGHARDGVAYHLPAGKLLFTGDILFEGAVGRTDFPGGSMQQLVRGITTHLMPMPPDTVVLSGHGPQTSIGEESLNNPYL